MEIQALREENANTRSSLNLHETQNEKTFDKLEKRIDDGFKNTQGAINNLTKLIIEKLN